MLNICGGETSDKREKHESSLAIILRFVPTSYVTRIIFSWTWYELNFIMQRGHLQTWNQKRNILIEADVGLVTHQMQDINPCCLNQISHQL